MVRASATYLIFQITPLRQLTQTIFISLISERFISFIGKNGTNNKYLLISTRFN